MTSKVLSRRSKAMTLAPIALLSGVWTASLFSPSATADDTESVATALPDGTAVPTEAIESPASVPVPGVIAAAVPEGAADSVVSGASSNGIPSPALSAYQRAAQIIGSADKSCNMPWELLAAVGRVESDHGRYNGNRLTEEGLSTPGIYGIALDGSNGTQVINDTDGGLLDNDEVYDRAVGSMQFIPTTWQVVKVDANGDGERNPQDINDAALAASVYLCSGEDDLSGRAGQEAALFRYNRSNEYVNLVLRIMEAYSSGDFTAVPSGAQGGTTFTPSYSSTIASKRELVRERTVRERRERQQQRDAAASGGSSSGGSSSGGSSSVVPDSGGDSAPAPSAPDSGGGVGDVVGGVVGGITGGNNNGGGGNGGGGNGGGGGSAPAPVVKAITEAEARVICLGRGISALNLSALNACIADVATG